MNFAQAVSLTLGTIPLSEWLIKVPNMTAEDDNLEYYSLFFKENKTCYFM